MLPCRNVFGVAMSSSPLGRGFEDGDVDVASPFVRGGKPVFRHGLAVYPGSTTLLSGPKALSRSDITGSEMGHGIATAGSSHRNPRARSG